MTTATKMTDRTSDNELVAIYADTTRTPTDRERAFFMLVSRHQHRLFRVCLHFLSSAADAEDAVQETFVRLARSAHTFRGDSQVSTWLYRIARNVATDRIRYEARRPATAYEDIGVVAEDTPTDDHLGAYDAAAMLREALNQLDDQSRQLLLLIAVDELTYEEASAATGLPVGTIKSRVSRARVRLGQLLDQPDRSDGRGPGRTATPDGHHPRQAAPSRGPPTPGNPSQPDLRDERPT